MSALPSALPGRKWLLGSAALLVLAGLGIYFWLLPATSVPEILLEGQDEKVVELINNARAAVVETPRSADAWGHLGRVLLANEIYPDISFACFVEAERLDPKNPRWPYFSAGFLAVNQGQPAEALLKLRRAVALQDGIEDAPSSPRLMLAETLSTLGQADEAASQFKHVLLSEPDNPRAHFGLGLLAYSHGQWQECRAEMEACLSSPQARKKASVHLAGICARLGDMESAERYAVLAARLPKDFDWSDAYVADHMHLAVRRQNRFRAVENLEGQGQFGNAASILKQLVADYPDEYLVQLMMGRILAQMKGQLPDAEAHLLKARKLAPEKIQTHYLLSLVLFEKGKVLLANGDPRKAKAVFEESVKSARAALALRSDYGYAHMALGLGLKQLDQRAAALSAFREAVHCNPEYADNHLFLAEALAEAGEAREARYYFDQAQLLAGPNDSRVRAARDRLAR